MLRLPTEVMISGKVPVCPLAATQGFPMTQHPGLQLVHATPLKLLQYVIYIMGCWQQISSLQMVYLIQVQIRIPHH